MSERKAIYGGPLGLTFTGPEGDGYSNPTRWWRDVVTRNIQRAEEDGITVALSAAPTPPDEVAEARDVCQSCGKPSGEVGYCYIMDNHTGNETDGPCASTFHPENQDDYLAAEAKAAERRE